ncbi:MAG: hypothetical protein JWM11_7958 [Planctomycetaceae bacterium]|nr:hypothetical protein [Planctomycetaceae bacterium]
MSDIPARHIERDGQECPSYSDYKVSFHAAWSIRICQTTGASKSMPERQTSSAASLGETRLQVFWQLQSTQARSEYGDTFRPHLLMICNIHFCRADRQVCVEFVVLA